MRTARHGIVGELHRVSLPSGATYVGSGMRSFAR